MAKPIFNRGDRVRHDIVGDGVVIASDLGQFGQIVHVRCDKGLEFHLPADELEKIA